MREASGEVQNHRPDQGRRSHRRAGIIDAPPALLRGLDGQSVIDLPCVEGHWMATVALPDIRYVGADLLPEIVA
jgi:hypothetical protein